ncbi:putative coiled-coil protein SlyX [Epilithonimonas hungarica]|uniref:hypothetical protein n=1 Tax=Epilithonimonas hungarica TaxID=454006 RepID=UPI0027842316|nr:hypothetical protein [Epilithonimonas hungarica]MDP9956561.1 putative coiled-coil protein SlyX [Epilithonimonas hungarica]
MKKNIILLGAIAISSLAFSQVGINTETPQATLDVAIKATGASLPEGIIAPRLTGDEIKSRDTLYDTPQKGAIVYATAPVGTASTKTANITAEGYYYFDGSVWTNFGSGTGASTPEPWYIQNTTTPASANTQNIYQNGKVAVGFSNTDVVSGKQFEVKGDVKAVTNNAGTYSILETNNTDFGSPVNVMFSSDNLNLIAATKYSTVSTSINEAGLSSLGSVGNSSVGATVNPSVGSKAEIRAGNATTNILNKIVVGTNGETEQVDKIILRSENSLADTATRLLVDKADGITFKHGNIGSPTGNYTFPHNNGTPGQVLVTNGAASTLMTGAQLSWQNVSDLAPEPWRIQGTTNSATSNTQNIYQTGNVSIGSSTPIASFTSNSVTVTPKLSITGDIASTGAFYTTTGKYADYVFEDYFDGASKIDETYKFKSLEETAAYIKANKHLPGVTSIKDILKTDNGYTVNLSELSIQQLEKIEELYLHTIEQQQEIIKQKTEVNDLISRMEKLEQLLVKEKNNK